MRPNMPRVDRVGDLVLTDPQTMRALADPVRLALLDRLRRKGPATTAELSSHVQATRSAIQAHLDELEAFGLVTRRVASGSEETRWQTVGKGFVFEIPDHP